MSGRGSAGWVKECYASNLYRSAFLSIRLQTSLLMARTVAVMARRAAKISTEDSRTFGRFDACTRNEPSPGTFAFGSIYSETTSGFQYPPDAFFFQAEDGIRDLTVTGVQTCALPI